MQQPRYLDIKIRQSDKRMLGIKSISVLFFVGETEYF